MWRESRYSAPVSGRPRTGRPALAATSRRCAAGPCACACTPASTRSPSKRHYLTEVVPAGRRAQDEAESVRARLVAGGRPASRPAHERDRRRAARAVPGRLRRLARARWTCTGPTSATTSRRAWAISRPAGSTPRRWTRSTRSCAAAAAVAPAASARSTTASPAHHECDDRCRPHQCRPLAPTTIRHIHFILSGAYKRAVRWGWVAENPDPRPSRRRRRSPTRSRRRPPRPPGSSPPRGATPTGARSCGSP